MKQISNDDLQRIAVEQIQNEAYQKGRKDENSEQIHIRQNITIGHYDRIANHLGMIFLLMEASLKDRAPDAYDDFKKTMDRFRVTQEEKPQ